MSHVVGMERGKDDRPGQGEEKLGPANVLSGDNADEMLKEALHMSKT